ncbi:MAG: lycopene cyclase family protein [Anaerolineae bacterium]
MPSAKTYDVIVAGGGAAGLSLAYRLAQAYPDRRLLIIDEKVKRENDHTWCYWSRGTSYLETIAYRTWDHLRVTSDTYDQVLDIAPYRYHLVRSSDFYRFIRDELGGRANVDFLLGTVERIADGETAAEVTVNALTYSGNWVFDSRYRAADYRPLTRRYHYLIQHFLGWELETSNRVFAPDCVQWFDFRTPQRDDMRFFYVLPYTERRALVEYTVFSANLLPLETYREALRAYINTTLGAEHYHILEEEEDLIPMTDHPARRRAGRRIMNIGTRGGRVKPSSGYAFRRIQSDATAIVSSLKRKDHPFDVPSTSPRYAFFDAMLLDILEHHGNLGKLIFTRLFQRNPITRVFRFLDEEDNWRENLKLMASVPSWPFIRAAASVAATRVFGSGTEA